MRKVISGVFISIDGVVEAPNPCSLTSSMRTWAPP